MEPGCNHASVARTLRAAEAVLRPDPQLFTHVQIGGLTPRHRAIVVDWLLDVAEEFGHRGETLFLAVDLLDRHLSTLVETTAWVQLLGAACIWTAAKVEEMLAPTSEDVLCLMQGAYNVNQLAAMERRMLNAVHHKVVRPTAYTFLSTLLHVSHAEQLWGSPPPGCSPAGGLGICPMCYWDVCEQKLPLATPSLKMLTPVHQSRVACRASESGSSTGTCALTCQRESCDVDGSEGSAGPNRADVPVSGGLSSAGHSERLSMCATACGDAWLDQQVSGQSTVLCVETLAAMTDGPCEDDPSITSVDAHEQHAWLVYVSRCIAEASLMDHAVLKYLPSEVAACCLMLARTMLGLPAWTPALAHYSQVEDPSDVAECLVTVARAHEAARSDPELQALRSRYGEGRRMDVIGLEPSAATRQLVSQCQAQVSARQANAAHAPYLSVFHLTQPAGAVPYPHASVPPVPYASMRDYGPSAGAPTGMSHSYLLPLDLTPATLCDLSPALCNPPFACDPAFAAPVTSPTGAVSPSQRHVVVQSFMDDEPPPAPHRGVKRHAVMMDQGSEPLEGTSSPRCKLTHALDAGAWGSAGSNTTTECVSSCMADLLSGLGLASGSIAEEGRHGVL